MPSDEEVWPDVIRLELRFEPATLSQKERARYVKAFLKDAGRAGQRRGIRGRLRHAGWCDVDGDPLPPVVWVISEDGPPPGADDAPHPVVKHKPKPKEVEMRECPFPGCGKAIKPEHFACYRHWFALTKDQQAEVYRIYDAWQRGEMSADELRRRQKAIVDAATTRAK